MNCCSPEITEPFAIPEQAAAQLDETLDVRFASLFFGLRQQTFLNEKGASTFLWPTGKRLANQGLRPSSRRGGSTRRSLYPVTTLRLYEPSQRHAIRKANLATFMGNVRLTVPCQGLIDSDAAAVFGFEEVSFSELDGHFHGVFVVRRTPVRGGGWPLPGVQDMCASVLGTRELEDGLLARVFPSKMSKILLTRHPRHKKLIRSELGFVGLLQHRRMRINCLRQTEIRPGLGEWRVFLSGLGDYGSA